jgi:ABC-type multidrug transport system fused ATPase/permease subunit
LYTAENRCIKIRRNLLERLLSRPGAYPVTLSGETGKTISPGELISYFRDAAEQIENTIAQTSQLIGEMLYASFCLAILLSINVQMTFFVFLPLLVMVAIVYYLPFVIYALQSLSEFIALAKQSQVSFERLTALSLSASAGKQEHHPASTLVARGSLTVITGSVGSGKTTLLRVLLGLLPTQAGEIYWNGERVHDPANFFVPPRSAYTPQVPKLFSYSLRDNLLLGLEVSPAAFQTERDRLVLLLPLLSLECRFWARK